MKHFLINLFNRAGLIKKINTVVSRKINGVTVQVPVMNGLGYGNLNISELWMCELLKKIISFKQGSFIDVGVNEGQTLIKLRTVHSTIDYVGFEPNPKCIYYTSALIKANQFKHCRLMPVGLFDKNTVLQLNLYSEGDTDQAASLIEDFRPAEKVFEKMFVAVNTFEHVKEVLDLQEIAIIKIDVEGAELEVLQSLEQTLITSRPTLLMEILPCYTNDNTSRIIRQQKVEGLLKRLEYHIIRVIKKEGGKSIEQFQRLDTIGVHGNMDWCEYIIVPTELSAKFFPA